MGEVWAATHVVTGRAVAVKRLVPALGSGTDADEASSRARFIREARAACAVDHPNVVDVLDFVDEPGEPPLLVMELLQGESLEQHLRRQGSLSVPETSKLLMPVALAIGAAHAQGIIHRDLKPANIFLSQRKDAELTIKVLDFGIAKLLSANGARSATATAPGHLLGTPCYMAPEQATGDPNVDQRVDIWSLGVILYECLSGARPIDGENLAQVFARLLQGNITPLEHLVPGLAPELVGLIGRMLAREAKQRPADVAEVSEVLGRLVIPGEAVRSLEPPPPTPTSHAGLRALNEGLAAPPTPFVGRTSELAHVLRLLKEPGVRLVTILGPGGMGKTRLAAELAGRLSADAAAPLRVVFVHLAPLDSPAHIVSALGEALGLRFHPSFEPKQQLLAALSGSRLLLVLDNFEHLLDGAPLISEVLECAAQIKVLATSRERLGLMGESVFALGGMALPELEATADVAACDAVAMFVDAARRSRHDFRLEDDAESVTRICRLVHGMPLGLVLAASWTALLPTADIAVEIERSLDFLASELRDLPERQRSLRAVFEQSWQLLNESERPAFAKLCVFRGGFTREAARVVAGTHLPQLARFLNKSLVSRDANGERFQVHEALRQFAELKLADAPKELDGARDRHAHYYAEFLGERESRLKGAEQSAALSEIDVELDNIRGAWRRLLERRDRLHAKKALWPLQVFYDLRAAVVEGEAAFRSLVAVFEAASDPADPDALAFLGCALAAQASCTREHAAAIAEPIFERALVLLDANRYPRERMLVLLDRGVNLASINQVDAGIVQIQQSLALSRAVGDAWATSNALHALGLALSAKGDRAASIAAYRECLVAQRQAGDGRLLLPMSVTALGVGLISCGERNEGWQLVSQGMALLSEFGNAVNTLNCQLDLSQAHLELDEFDKAAAAAEPPLQHAIQLGALELKYWATTRIANARLGLVELAEAERYFRDAAAMGRAMDDAGKVAVANLGLAELALLAGRTQEAIGVLRASCKVFAEGGQPWASGRGRALLGFALVLEAEYAQAAEQLNEALRLSLAAGTVPQTLRVLAAYAWLLARTQQAERAAELLACVMHHPLCPAQARDTRLKPLLRELKVRLDPDKLTLAILRGKRLDPRAIDLLS